MKATKYLSLAALALMGTLASCQSDDEAAVSFARPDNAVGINVSVGSLKGTTRSNPAATDDTQREFNLGDQISVSTNGQDPVIFQCQDADQQTWAEAEAGKFLLWTQNEMTFKAYYPATDGTSMTAFTLPADQSSEAKIALADYMTRQKTCNNENGTDITLDLERKTARVIVRIAGFTDQYNNDDKTVDNVRIYSEASGIEEGNPTGSSTEIQPYAQGSYDGWGWRQNSTFTALVVPGYGDSGARFITLSDGESNTLEVKGIPELEAGNSYTFNLTVGKNTIQVQSVTVTDWTGETLTGGQATEAVPVTAITLNKTATSIKVGSTETLSVTAVAPDNATDKTYTWKTSDETKATVDQDGKVTAVAAGTVTIYAEANDGSGVKGNCTVTVTPATYPLISAATTEDYGKVVCAAGHLHDAKTAVPSGCTAVGILGKVTETGHGLIFSLQNAKAQAWNTINGWTSVTTYAGTTLKVLPNQTARENLASYTALGETTVSNWAVGQKSDYEAIFTNLGSTVDDFGKTYDGNVNAYITTGVGGTAISGLYWSATEVDADYQWNFDSECWNFGFDKTYSLSVRPVLGF